MGHNDLETLSSKEFLILRSSFLKILYIYTRIPGIHVYIYKT